MITVRSFDDSRDEAPFEPGTSVLGPVSLPTGAPVRGEFGQLGDTLLVLYRADGALRLLVGDQDIEVTEGLEARHEFGEGSNTLTVGARRIDYPRPDHQLYEDDPTPFVELEHFDLGLFLANVLSDPPRCGRMYR
ncbi:hypothetical protein ACFY0G_05990 [Streptomyces sp. NPDC001552]|uniref:hypothetical protein n=1 Tax=Streptomyces sp. NPDC001552 TaxID=3364587 RepID=UPI003687677F